jgi:predicted phosphodiesterase
MKIRLFSDIHNEFAPVDYKIPELPEDSDTVLVLAGDIDVGGAKESLLDELSGRFKAVVYVSGNHEYYNHDIDTLDDVLWYRCVQDNVHYLYNDNVVIDGVMFYGGTGWTNIPEEDAPVIQHSMNDFRSIKKVDPNTAKIVAFSPYDANENNLRFKKNLDIDLSNKQVDKVVIVSHHTPSYLSCDDEFIGDRLNCAYHNEFDDLIKDNPNIKLWCHGHIHSSKDYMIGETRVVANPYGYYNYETNPDFDSTKVIEI